MGLSATWSSESCPCSWDICCLHKYEDTGKYQVRGNRFFRSLLCRGSVKVRLLPVFFWQAILSIQQPAGGVNRWGPHCTHEGCGLAVSAGCASTTLACGNGRRGFMWSGRNINWERIVCTYLCLCQQGPEKLFSPGSVSHSPDSVSHSDHLQREIEVPLNLSLSLSFF